MRILHRTKSVAESGREGFTESSSHYDVARMVVIRLAALLEHPEFAASARLLTTDEVAAIRTTRNIAAHAGYDGMNDDLFWIAVTVRVPSIIHRLLDSWPR
ncbi:antitoxin [Glaciibacter superstes]|uniref:antitoxin n=1 Tax=Glaciibacter superstes TaxID=501023 RepID=UPI0004291CE3|nr:antitoxin [Glaciibacter superstes]